MMRRHRLSPALPALFAILAGCGDAPSTIAPDHVFDAGGVSADRAELSHVFVVENPSEADWNVDRVVPTCHCVRTAQGPLSIPAHGSARVPVSIDLRSLAGTVEYSVRLFSGDFPRGHLDLTLRAQLDRRALVSPRELVLPESGPGEVVNRTLLVSTPLDVERVVLGPLPEGTSGEVDRRGTEVEGGYVVRLAFVSPSTPGPYETHVEVRVIGATTELTVVPVRGIVSAPLDATPAYLVLDPARASESIVLARPDVASAAGTPVVSNLPHGVECAVDEFAAGSWRLSFRRTAEARPGTVRTTVALGGATAVITLDLFAERAK